MKTSRQRLDLSTSGSPESQMSPFGSPTSERTYDISITNAIKLQHDIKEKLDFIISGGDSIELQRVGSDLMKIINSALQNAPETKPEEKASKIHKGNSTSTLKTSSSTPHSRSTGRIARGIMRNPAADDRSIAENHSHLELRESNRILEDFLSALPVYQAEETPAQVDNQKVRKARSLIPPKPQPEIIPDVTPPRRLTILSLFFGIPGDSMYTRCLGFADKDFLTTEIKWDYFAFKASDLNFPMVSFILLIGCFIFLLRINYAQINNVTDSPVFVAAVISSILAALCIGIIIFNRLTLLSHKYNVRCLKGLHLPMIQLMKSYYGQLADDGVLVLCSIAGALCLFSSILPSESCGEYFSNLNHQGNYFTLSYFIISHHISLYFIISCLITSYFVTYYHISSYLIIFYHIISYHILFYHILSYLIISYHILSYLIIFYHIMSYHILFCHILSYLIISYYILSYHVLSYLILSHIIISHYILSYHVLSHLIISHHISLYFIISCLIISYFITYYHISSYLIIIYHIMSYHILSYLILSHIIMSHHISL